MHYWSILGILFPKKFISQSWCHFIISNCTSLNLLSLSFCFFLLVNLANSLFCLPFQRNNFFISFILCYFRVRKVLNNKHCLNRKTNYVPLFSICLYSLLSTVALVVSSPVMPSLINSFKWSSLQIIVLFHGS